MKRLIIVSVFSLVSIVSQICNAKIADPKGVYKGGVMFCSHSNSVYAVKTKNRNYYCGFDRTDAEENRVIWEVTLPFKVDPEKFNLSLERDVQLCIVTSLRIDGPHVVATGCNYDSYWLSRKTGKLIRKN